MIDNFVKQLIKKPDIMSIKKAKLEIIDWIGYSVAGTFTEQAKPFNSKRILLILTLLKIIYHKRFNDTATTEIYT